MPTSSVPPVSWTPEGFVAPDESAILAGVQADQNAAFGGDMNPALETPQGQLATSTTAVIGEANSQFLKITTQVDPAYADGRMQDAIARIYFLTRNPPLPTIVLAACMGLAGVVIPQGALAQATDGNLYTATDGGTIPLGGTTNLEFACTLPGPIACPALSLSQIYQSIPGWDAISNAADGVLGTNVESRADFEFRRAQSVASNAQGVVGSIIGSVAQVSGVLDYYGIDNSTGAPLVIGTQTIAANSIYIAAAGGTDLAVATAILRKKGPGAAYTGNTTVVAYDDNPLYAAPIPYTVKFQRPAALPVLFAVNLKNGPDIPANAAVLIKNAIIAAFAGADGGARARIGSTIYASRYYATVALLGSWAQIIEILVGTVTANANSVDVEINEVPTISADDIEVSLI